MIRTPLWPSSWKARIRCSGMPRPMWMSGDVTSIPNLTRRGRPSFSFASRPPSGRTLTALRVSSAMPTAKTLEVCDLERLELVCGLEAEHAANEVQRRRDRAAHVLPLAEAVPLPLECNVRVRNALAIERVGHHLRLVREHDLVLEPLQKEQRSLDPVGEVHRGTRPVELDLPRVGPDQRVEIARLELVGLDRERLDVGDAEVAHTGRERRGIESERAKHDVAAGATALYPGPLRVGLTLLGEVARGCDAVLPVDLAPAPVEQAPIAAAEPGAAAVVDVHDPDAALCPEQELRRERGASVAGRAAVADDPPGRALARRPLGPFVRGRVVERVRFRTVAQIGRAHV